MRCRFLDGALSLALAIPCASWAAEPIDAIGAASPVRPAVEPIASGLKMRPDPLSWETGAGKSYAVPAAGIFAFQFLLNQYDRHFQRPNVYKTNFSTFKRNLERRWVVDNDEFSTNQFLHPYQGSVYHGLARSAGLNYWESLGYTFAGSLVWETAGETTPPSFNDQIASGIAGTFLGEPLFRMASLMLEEGGGRPGFWRELGAAVISPSMGFNRLVFGERFDAVFPSRNPAYFARLHVGASATSYTESGASQSVKRNEGIVDYAMSYGLPGKRDYGYTRPFDYFDFEFTASTANILENIFSRGLLVGKEYSAGDNYRGVWGLYGSYDYVAPQIFRISSTALSLGTTGQWWLSKSVALQVSALGGVGYGAAGTIHGVGERDYHYGVTPQALLSLRFIFGETASVQLVGRDYYVSRLASTADRGRENVARLEGTFTLRVSGRHAISLRYVASERDASYPDLGNRHQTRGTIGLFYTLLGDKNFGAVDWR